MEASEPSGRVSSQLRGGRPVPSLNAQLQTAVGVISACSDLTDEPVFRFARLRLLPAA